MREGFKTIFPNGFFAHDTYDITFFRDEGQCLDDYSLLVQ